MFGICYDIDRAAESARSLEHCGPYDDGLHDVDCYGAEYRGIRIEYEPDSSGCSIERKDGIIEFPNVGEAMRYIDRVYR